MAFLAGIEDKSSMVELDGTIEFIDSADHRNFVPFILHQVVNYDLISNRELHKLALLLWLLL